MDNHSIIHEHSPVVVRAIKDVDEFLASADARPTEEVTSSAKSVALGVMMRFGLFERIAKAAARVHESGVPGFTVTAFKHGQRACVLVRCVSTKESAKVKAKAGLEEFWFSVAEVGVSTHTLTRRVQDGIQIIAKNSGVSGIDVADITGL